MREGWLITVAPDEAETTRETCSAFPLPVSLTANETLLSSPATSEDPVGVTASAGTPSTGTETDVNWTTVPVPAALCASQDSCMATE